MQIFRALAAFSAILLIPALPATAKKASEVKFKCHGGKTMKVVFGSKTATVIYEKGKPVALPQSLAADGFLYASSKYSLRGKGDRVTWNVRGKKPVNCHTR